MARFTAPADPGSCASSTKSVPGSATAPPAAPSRPAPWRTRSLGGCYRKCLELAEERAVRVISFPAIGTGVYGYPLKEAAEIAIREVKAHLAKPETNIQQVIFVVFSKQAYDAYAASINR